MLEHWKDNDYSVVKEKIVPVSVKDSKDVDNAKELSPKWVWRLFLFMVE